MPSVSLVAQEISFSRPAPHQSIHVSADAVTRWQSGQNEVLHLQGGVLLKQDELQLKSENAILWVELPTEEAFSRAYKVIVYLEGNAEVRIPNPSSTDPSQRPNKLVDDTWLGRLYTHSTVDLKTASTALTGDPPPIFTRASRALREGWQSSVSTVQFQASNVQDESDTPNLVVNPQTGELQQILPPSRTKQPTFVSPELPRTEPGNIWPASSSSRPGTFQQTPNPVESNRTFQVPNREPNSSSRSQQGFSLPASSGMPSVQFGSRNPSEDLNLSRSINENNPNESIAVLTGGVRITIDNPEFARVEAFRGDQERQITILANNVVAWSQKLPSGETQYEIYLEGNVVFTKDRRVIYAERMYYNVGLRTGTILSAEILTPAQKFEGLVRLKADVIQQVDENNLQAYGAAFTSSRMGVPRYWLQSENMLLNRQSTQVVDPQTGYSMVDPQSGQPLVDDQFFVQSNSNRIYVSGVPVFFWPRFQANLENPTMFLDRLKIGNDNIFGTQVQTAWNMPQLLGIRNPPTGVRTVGILDYLSERGIGFGSETTYARDDFFGIQGATQGVYKSWFINDDGTDLLGRGRGNLTPEEDFRGRAIWQHTQQFAPGSKLKMEFGYLSDRNFLEQFYEREWDQYKDATTGLWYEQNIGTQSFNVTADYQINDFFTQTSWLPKLDHFVIGQPLFGDRVVWHAHSHFGYGRMRVAEPPLNASELAKFDPLAWEADVDGIRSGTRHEFELPTQIGPTRVVPYVLGDITYWQEDLTGNDLLRGYGQAGLRASLPFWKVDPTIQSTLWNVNGLAHKVTFDVDAFFAEASQDLDELPLYDPLDDDAQEDFRRRFAFDTFGILPGGNTPLRFDERMYALRSGLQGFTSSPSAEIADDLTAIKFGIRQRWQTKRGAPGNERIIDWITLDSEIMFYPKADRDNFGAEFGMFDYDFRWHVGDRFTLVSDGYFDLFSQGLRTASFGMHFGRPSVGNLYLGYRMIEGPISSNIITATATYRMSEKWGLKGLSQIDFGETGTIGQALSFVYIGESFLWQFGINADLARDNVGFRFGFEPRFLRRSRMFNPGGVAVGPAGAKWLE